MSTFDYNNKNFSKDDLNNLLEESKILLEKYPDKIPILIQIDSNILKIEKHKYLVANDLHVDYYFDILKKRLFNLNSDTLIISITKYINGNRSLLPAKHYPNTLKDFYNEYKDDKTGMLILTLSRYTTYKRAKKFIGYYLGY